MGLHSPFGYVGYEAKFLKTFINLLDDFCTGCHTSDDFYKGCQGCPVGNLIYESKYSLMDCYEPEGMKIAKYFKQVKKAIKRIHPCPFFAGLMMPDTGKRSQPDQLKELRKLLLLIDKGGLG